MSPSVSGGDIAITASARRNQPPAPRPASPASTEKPANPTARRGEVALVGAGERVDAGDRAPRRSRSPPDRAGRPSRARWRGRGTTAARSTTCSSWPRAASSSTMRVITRPVGAVSGSKCGPSTTIRSGRIASSSPRGHRRYASARRAPDARVVNRAARRRPAATSSSRRAGDVVERARPRVGRRAGARARRRRRPRAGRPGRCRRPACRAPSPRARARRSPRTRAGTRAPRRRR